MIKRVNKDKSEAIHTRRSRYRSIALDTQAIANSGSDSIDGLLSKQSLKELSDGEKKLLARMMNPRK